jgi:nucleoside-diphosphate-sugar epimerase
MRLVVIGAGDLGGEVARRWVADGGEAIGVTRTEARHADLAGSGVTPTTGPARALLRPTDRVLLATAGSEAQAQAAAALADVEVSRLVFASTTGFHEGSSGPVGPGSPAGPTERAQAAGRAEAIASGGASPCVIVRLGGLYRAGRGPLSALLQRGAAPPGPADRPLALIHTWDAAAALLAALRHASPDPVYLAVTPPLPTRREFWERACARHGLPAPAFTPPTGAPPISYDVASLRRDLLPAPAHPDWREATEA